MQHGPKKENVIFAQLCRRDELCTWLQKILNIFEEAAFRVKLRRVPDTRKQAYVGIHQGSPVTLLPSNIGLIAIHCRVRVKEKEQPPFGQGSRVPIERYPAFASHARQVDASVLGSFTSFPPEKVLEWG